jgi:recombination protein RecT
MSEEKPPYENPGKVIVNIEDLRTLFEKAKPSLASVLPKHLTPERVMKIALSAVSRTPMLMKCTATSILHSVMIGSQLGLESGGPFGHAYLVPYFNGKRKVYEAQLIPGYRGLVDLARRSGKVSNIEARIVREKDDFSFKYGTHPEINHNPAQGEDMGEMTHVYAVAWLSDGRTTFEVMTKEQVDKIRNMSKAKDSGPWVDFYDEMARKTVTRKLCKYLPLTSELATAIELENRAEQISGVGDLIDLDSEEVPEETPEMPKRKSEKAKKETKPTNEEESGGGLQERLTDEADKKTQYPD